MSAVAKRRMPKWLRNAIIAVVGAVVAGLIVNIIWDGRPSPTSPASDAPSSESSKPVASDTASPTTPAAAPPEPRPTPTPLDNQTLTEARVEVVGRKISPGLYEAGSPPGYYVKVFTAAGELDWRSDCYVHFELYNNDVLLTTGDAKCGLKPSWASAWWPNGTSLDDGTVRVVADITTDWGATTTTETSFAVRRD